jgi:DNA-binding transcriptional LysR family regulator
LGPCSAAFSIPRCRTARSSTQRSGARESSPNVVLEADSLLTLISNVRRALLHTVLPHGVLSVMDHADQVTVTPLEPELTREIGLITRDLPSRPPLVSAVWEVTKHLDMQESFDAFLNLSEVVAHPSIGVS